MSNCAEITAKRIDALFYLFDYGQSNNSFDYIIPAKKEKMKQDKAMREGC